MKTKQRCLALILIIIYLCSFIQPVNSYSLLDSRFNLDYNNSKGKTIMGSFYSNDSIPKSFSKLADRALALKKSYSYSEAIQILTETKTILNKTTVSDYDLYEERFEKSIELSGSMAYQFTYDSFIMRNVLYSMYRNKASYTQMLNALQIVYDCAVIQTKKDAFRSDALDVLRDLNILASLESDKDRSDMLFYISNIASGTHGSYDGKTTIPSINLSKNYDAYLKEKYDESHTDTPVQDNTNRDESDYFPDGYTPDMNPDRPSNPGTSIPPLINDDDFTSSGPIRDDSFSSDIDGIAGDTTAGKLILCYTTNKNETSPTYTKSKITTKQFVTYANIVSVLTTAARNTDLIIVEDSDAVLAVYDGKCVVVEKNDTLYDVQAVAKMFETLNGFGLALCSDSDFK